MGQIPDSLAEASGNGGGEKLRPSITTHLARPRAIASGLAPVPKTKEGDRWARQLRDRRGHWRAVRSPCLSYRRLPWRPSHSRCQSVPALGAGALVRTGNPAGHSYAYARRPRSWPEKVYFVTLPWPFISSEWVCGVLKKTLWRAVAGGALTATRSGQKTSHPIFTDGGITFPVNMTKYLATEV